MATTPFPAGAEATWVRRTEDTADPMLGAAIVDRLTIATYTANGSVYTLTDSLRLSGSLPQGRITSLCADPDYFYSLVQDGGTEEWGEAWSRDSSDRRRSFGAIPTSDHLEREALEAGITLCHGSALYVASQLGGWIGSLVLDSEHGHLELRRLPDFHPIGLNRTGRSLTRRLNDGRAQEIVRLLPWKDASVLVQVADYRISDGPTATMSVISLIVDLEVGAVLASTPHWPLFESGEFPFYVSLTDYATLYIWEAL